MNNSERTGSVSSLLENVTAGLQQATSQAESNNVLTSAFEGQSATPLFDQLVAGDFYCLHWKQFVSMCGRIAQEEKVPWTDIHEYILAYLDENEPVEWWNYLGIARTDYSGNGNNIYLLKALRNLLKNMPLSESERRAFEHWQADFSLRTGKVPSFIQAMYDIIDGKYDHDPKEAERLMDIAIDELEKPDCDPRWENVASRASDHLTEILFAKAEAFGTALKEKKAAKKKQTEGRNLRGDEPDWLISMYDIIDGKYDNDLDEIGRLLDIAAEEVEKPGSNPQWDEIAHDAADHLTVLLMEWASSLGMAKKI